MDIKKAKKGLECCLTLDSPCGDCPYYSYEDIQELDCERNLRHDAIALIKEQDAKQYNNHEVACILADLFGDPCACNFNDIDTWLPYKCDFRETCCPNPVGVACWEQYLKHKEGR